MKIKGEPLDEYQLMKRAVVENSIIQEVIIGLLLNKKILTKKDIVGAVKKAANNVVKKAKKNMIKDNKEPKERPNYFG